MKRRKRKDKGQIVRIEELEKIMGEYGEDVDPEAIVSLYRPYRRSRMLGAALLRYDKVKLALLLLCMLVGGLFLTAFVQEKMGDFTVNLNRLEMYRKGIAIAEDGDFTDATAELSSVPLAEVTNIALEDIPEGLHELEGSNNGNNYVAYTFFIRNAGKEDMGYIARLRLESAAKGAENALRVILWRNGDQVMYAEPAADGTPEEGCVSFEEHDLVCTIHEPDFKVGYVDRYTVVIWMEGNDPECVDAIIGGGVQLGMRFDSDDSDDTSLVWKFFTDIRDTLTGNKPIGAAGTDPADYYQDQTVTWSNRRNQ